jgi:hypothetical protein
MTLIVDLIMIDESKIFGSDSAHLREELLNVVFYFLNLIFLTFNDLVIFVVLKDLKIDGLIFGFRFLKVVNNRLNFLFDIRVHRLYF